MKTQSIYSIIFGSAFLLFSPWVYADQLPMSEILKNLQTKGYPVILKIELEGNIFKAKVIDDKGKEYKLEITPDTGKISNPKAQTPRLTMEEAVKKVEESGYQRIFKVESDEHEYEMKGYDKENKKVSLEVDAATGKINKEWF